VNDQSHTEHLELMKAIKCLHKTVQERQAKARRMPARKRAALQKRTAAAFNAVLGDKWK